MGSLISVQIEIRSVTVETDCNALGRSTRKSKGLKST